MDETGRVKIATTLQKQSDVVALRSSQLLFARWGENTQMGSTAATRPVSIPQNGAKGAEDRDELSGMMRDGFRRLGGVIALSVMVDEPGLIVDDMQWLKRLFGARRFTPPDPGWISLLLASYVEATGTVLAPEEVESVRAVAGRALDQLAKEKSEPNPDDQHPDPPTGTPEPY